jgi:hypothetical protein
MRLFMSEGQMGGEKSKGAYADKKYAPLAGKRHQKNRVYGASIGDEKTAASEKSQRN